jgi:hypothetical protein
LPFFFIAPVWLLLVIAGVLVCISKKLRFLASYLILGSTLGLIASLAFSFGTSVLLAKILGSEAGSVGGLIIVLGFVTGMLGGGVIGVLAGGWLAHRLNRRLGVK